VSIPRELCKGGNTIVSPDSKPKEKKQPFAARTVSSLERTRDDKTEADGRGSIKPRGREKGRLPEKVSGEG